MSEMQSGNTFSEGLNLDTPDFQTPNSVYTFASNATFITHEGNELIMQNERGTEYKSSLKENYVPLAISDYSGVAYIISAEVINNDFTGRGEIGTFPSPDYENAKEFDCTSQGCNFETELIPEYKPFQNYGGDGNSPINPILSSEFGEFNSINFNFQIDKPVEIVSTQTSYDGTVNIIFTDNFNKAKLINSRFSVRPNNKVEIINRGGSNDTNLYRKDNFNNTLNHIFVSNKLTTVTFDGQTTGGDLAVGQYRYFFQYLTADDNVTNVFAESFNIPVFFGNSVANTRGGITNENTNKVNELTIHNVDTAYSAIKVFFQYSSGTVGAEATRTVFQIEQDFPIDGTEVLIKHTGFENTTPVESTQLSLDFAAIDTYKTGCEIKGRLAIANIKLKQYDVNLLIDFGKEIKIHTIQKRMTIPGLDDDVAHSAIYTDLNYNATSLDTFEGAYYNPKNVHDYLGYWGGEAYMFGITFIFDDGTYSPVIPIRGHDNLNDNASYSSQTFADRDFDSLTGENVRGIYRFPQRVDNPLITVRGGTTYANLLIPEFEVPNLTDEIKRLGVVGYRFHRSQRKLDCVGQGQLFDTIIFPKQDGVLEGNQGLNYFGNFFENSGYRENNSRYFPAYNYLFEGAGRQARNDNDDRPSPTSTRTRDTGVEVMRQHHRYFESEDNLDFYFKRKFAFISPDFICNPIANQRLFSTDNFTLKNLGKIESIYAIKSNTPFVLERGRGSSAPWKNIGTLETDRSFSLIKQTSLNPPIAGEFQDTKVEAEYVAGGISSTTGRNFSSRATLRPLATNFQNKDEIFDDPDGAAQLDDRRDYSLFAAVYNDYVGITSEDFIDLGSVNAIPTLGPGDGDSNSNNTVPVIIGDVEYEVSPGNGVDSPQDLRADSLHLNGFNFTNGVIQRERTSNLINLYKGDGPRTIEQLESLYSPNSEIYFPITQPIYDSLEDATRLEAVGVNGVIQTKNNLSNGNGNLEAFNGDCFVNMTHRRLFYSALDRDGAEKPAVAATNLGHTLAFVSESNYNVAGRTENVIDTTEGERSFHPYLARNHQEADSTTSIKGEDDDWRFNRLPETKQYNTGYDSFEGGRNYAAISSNLPFIQNVFDTRIWISEPYTSASFDNQFRFFLPAAFKDYSQEYGEITSIKAQGGNILMVQEYGTAVVPVSQRIAQQGDSAGAVFFEASQLLTPAQYIGQISSIHGSQWQFSIVATDNYIYGVDMNTSKIWRTRGQSLELISDLKIQSFLRDLRSQYDNQQYQWFFKQIRAYYDKRKGDVLFTFASSAGADVCGTTTIETSASCVDIQGDGNGITISGGTPSSTEEIPKLCYGDTIFNIVYNEQTNKWKTFNSWYPVNAFLIHDELYSFPLIENRNKIYMHYVSDKYSFFYDENHDFVVEINVVSSSKLHKTFDNLMLVQNELYPYKIEYTTSTGTRVQTIQPRNVEGRGSEPFMQESASSLINYDFVYKEDIMYGVIKPDDIDIREAEDTYGNLAPLDERRVRDKFCKIRFYYNTNNNVYIQYIETNINRSFS